MPQTSSIRPDVSTEHRLVTDTEGSCRANRIRTRQLTKRYGLNTVTSGPQCGIFR